MRLSTYVVTVPVVAIAAVLAVANRQVVTFSLDPFSQAAPAIAFVMPLFVLLFLAILFGVLLGGLAVAMGRGPRKMNGRKGGFPPPSLRSALSFGGRKPKSPSQ
jgi:hypothetical protein